MDPGNIFKFITNSTLLAMQLLPTTPESSLSFVMPQYCTLLPEDTPISTQVAQVQAIDQGGLSVRYRISGGNRDGLFTIDRNTGSISLAAQLDFETNERHVLEVTAETGSFQTKVSLFIFVADVNDNPPYFEENNLEIALMEEDDRNLPGVITKVIAKDRDLIDKGSLQYSLEGEGVEKDYPGGPFFTIRPQTGEVILLRALDRDPPNGRSIYKLKIRVQDGNMKKEGMKNVGEENERKKRSTNRMTSNNLRQSQIFMYLQRAWVKNEASNLFFRRLIGKNNLYEHNMNSTSRSLIEKYSRGILWLRTRRKIYITIQNLEIITNFSLDSKSVFAFLSDLHRMKGNQFLSSPKTLIGKRKHTESVKEEENTIDREINYEKSKNRLKSRNEIRRKGENEGPTKRCNMRKKAKSQFFLREWKKIQSYFPLKRSKSHRIKEEIGLHDKNIFSIEKSKLLEYILENFSYSENEQRFTQKGKRYALNILLDFSLSCQCISNELNQEINYLQFQFASSLCRNWREGKLNNDGQVYWNSKKASKTNYQESNLHVCSCFKRMFLRTFACIRLRHKKLHLFHCERYFFEILLWSALNALGGQEIRQKINIFLPKSKKQMRKISLNRLSSIFINLKLRNNSICFYFGYFPAHICESNQNYYFKQNIGLMRKYFKLSSLPLKILYHPKYFLAELKENLLMRSPQNYKKPQIPFRNCWKKYANIFSLKEKSKIKHESNQKPTIRLPMKKFFVENSNYIHRSKSQNKSAYIIRKTRNASQLQADVQTERQRKPLCLSLNNTIQIYQPDAKRKSKSKGNLELNPLAQLFDHFVLNRGKHFSAETILTIVVQDINDNAPIFPEAIIYGEVQENGPIDLIITKVNAWDSDDATSGTNAKLTYALEKNIIEEWSGEPLFRIQPVTGELRTAHCCLDRETTPEFRIQVVATDGGGLKGTSTVVVRLSDVNDNSPRLLRHLWDIVTPETHPSDEPLVEITVADPDTTNNFLYRIVNSSGPGWDHFEIKTKNGAGHLFVGKVLDYENDLHRQGFRFKVQVTDRVIDGNEGWDDPRNVDTAFINVTLHDVNDNAPEFGREAFHITVSEDLPLNTIITSIPAMDRDQLSGGSIYYHLQDTWGCFKVGNHGEISVAKSLDRDSPPGGTGVVKIIAMDNGSPKLSATATLKITLTDVNDCPPRLLPPHVLHVQENRDAKIIGQLRATDDDLWSQGNGPPFTFELASSNPSEIFYKFDLKFHPELDSGRGGALLWTRLPLDREQSRSITVDILLRDAKGLEASHPLDIIIDDVNDNKMTPAHKTVYIWRTKDVASSFSIGRVYVNDPDDWDLKDKSFAWVKVPHPLFRLNKDTGELFASNEVQEGRYELALVVSDHTWNQVNVRGNVSVIVKIVPQDALTNAIPIFMSLVSPSELTLNWDPLRGGGALGSLVVALKRSFLKFKGEFMVVSIYGSNESISQSDKNETVSSCIWVSFLHETGLFMNPVKLKGLLEIGIHKESSLSSAKSIVYLKVRDETNLNVSLEYFSNQLQPKQLCTYISTSLDIPQNLSANISTIDKQSSHPSYTASSIAAFTLPLEVIDNNSTSFVSPRLNRCINCLHLQANRRKPGSECSKSSCLNGGRCVSFEGIGRCICPGDTLEPFCKISTREFGQGGWAWIQRSSIFIASRISVRVKTNSPNGMILYSGPLTSWPVLDIFKNPPRNSEEPTIQHYSGSSSAEDYLHSVKGNAWSAWYQSSFIRRQESRRQATPLFTLFLQEGQPHLIIERIREAVRLVVKTVEPLNDAKWHLIHVISSEKKILLMVDYCMNEIYANKSDFTNCSDSKTWSTGTTQQNPSSGTALVQIGGLAHPVPPMKLHNWSKQPIGSSLEGCIGDFRIDDELIDLGSPAYSSNSKAGCQHKKKDCSTTCEKHNYCSQAIYERELISIGHMRSDCVHQMEPVTFERQSYAKVALSFTPSSLKITTRMQVRTRNTNASLMHLTSRSRKETISLTIKNENVCFTFKAGSIRRYKKGKNYNSKHQKSDSFGSSNLTNQSRISNKEFARSVCVSTSVSDGAWHTIRAAKFGPSLLVEIDGGDDGKWNESLIKLNNGITWDPVRFNLDVRDGVSIGGVPVFYDGNLKQVIDDLFETCITDLRIDEKHIPLPPVLNETKWGQVTTFERIKPKCNAVDPCENIPCESPLVCRDEWRMGICRCPPGQVITELGCRPEDLCSFAPCLNGGSCIQGSSGISCMCQPNHTGQYCEWELGLEDQNQTLSTVILVSSSLFLGILLLALGLKIFLFFSKRTKRRQKPKSDIEEQDCGRKGIFYISDLPKQVRKNKRRIDARQTQPKNGRKNEAEEFYGNITDLLDWTETPIDATELEDPTMFSNTETEDHQRFH